MLADFDDEQRNAIFPANIVITNSGEILDVSRAVARIYPQLAIGDRLVDHFDLHDATTNQPITIGPDVKSLIRLDPRSGTVPISGWIVPAEQDYLLALRITPANYNLDNPVLQMADFHPGDPVVHGILMASMQRSLIEEQSLIARDLTQAREKAEQLLMRFRRLAGFMAHDFNNYLSIIKLNSERLLAERSDDIQLTRIVDIISSTARRGSMITRSLMTLASQPEDAALPVVIDDLVKQNEAFLSSVVGTQVQLMVELNAEGQTCLLSPVTLLNCLVNLLVNARDAMPEGGQVSLTTSLWSAADNEPPYDPAQSTGLVRLAVTDNGRGMTEEVLSQAFEPLFSTKELGNGLGLASVRDFAVALGGQAQALSRPGEGTTVEILLPTCQPADSQPRVVASPHDAGSGAGTRSILVVEDEPYALEALCELLEGAGFAVQGAASAGEARQLLSNATFDLLLTDIVLAQDSGVELAQAARQMVPGIKILLMSGYVPAAEMMDVEWQLVQKPINSTHLINVIRSLV